ncbi:hypothetical protein [Pseudomonas sp. MWU12-2029]|uniref:hypothetical protein n=1 Tax=Pseudomonas sp. MWU12-2029 TaxID=2927805 RepID=UPI002010892D|nr:hypothetical protein [Pseudomonas sp. MWU12-2029]
MDHKTTLARLSDAAALIASNAFTGCAAAVIALDTSPSSQGFFSIQGLANYALIAFIFYELLAFALWLWNSYKVRKLLTEDGYRLIPQWKEKDWELISDPVLLKRVRQALIRKNADMQTVCLATTLMAIGMIAAMILGNTGITAEGGFVSTTAKFAYALPVLIFFIFFPLGLHLYVSGRRLKKGANQWISITRKPNSDDIEKGFDRDIVLCRSPVNQIKWGGHYRVIKISNFENGLPPKSRRDGIEWAPVPR